MTLTAPEPRIAEIVDALRARDRVVLSSHARPDGDSIGSQLALAGALRHLDKEVRLVNHDPVPPYLRAFAGVDAIEVADAVDGTYDAAVVMECGSLERTEVAGLDRYFVINVDHHVGNTMYGAINWFDESAAACGEMVFDLVEGLGVPLTEEIGAALYVAILTDTGAFHHGHITSRTFEICRRIADAGISAAEMAARVYHTSSVGKLRLTGSLLQAMRLEGDGRVAVLQIDDRLLDETGCAPDDIEGLINMPLSAAGIQAVILVKALHETIRISLRSKGAVDVRAVAVAHGGGGHHNASGCTLHGPLADAERRILSDVIAAVDGHSS